MNDLKKIIGSDYKSYPLKSIRRRLQKKFSWSTMPKDPVRLIITKDGKKYKLITYRKQTKSRVEFIFKHRSYLESLDFIPTIVYIDDPRKTDRPKILVEYVDGHRPDMATVDFAESLGSNLAQLHQFKLESQEPKQFIEQLIRDLTYLLNKNFLTRHDFEKIIERVHILQPKEILRTIVNGDLQPDNFITNDKGRLNFIDIGAFRYGIPGHALIASNIYDKINKKVFKGSYLQTGGSNYIFDNEQFFYLASNISNSAYSLELSYKLPLYEIRRKIRRKRQAKRGIENLVDNLFK